VLLIAPLLSQWYALGLIDTYQALIYSNFSFTVPFTVWMLVGYFDSIPRELEESALIDGCGRFAALLRVVLPLAAPGIAATAIFAFVTSWSELLFAITFTSQTEMRTLSAGLLFMVGQYEIQWGQLSAGVMISTVPVAILFTYLQRHRERRGDDDDDPQRRRGLGEDHGSNHADAVGDEAAEELAGGSAHEQQAQRGADSSHRRALGDEREGQERDEAGSSRVVDHADRREGAEAARTANAPAGDAIALGSFLQCRAASAESNEDDEQGARHQDPEHAVGGAGHPPADRRRREGDDGRDCG